jgi:hypothetical protein
MELEYVEKHILSFLDVEFHQNKLEEGSRMTQIYEEFAVWKTPNYTWFSILIFDPFCLKFIH